MITKETINKLYKTIDAGLIEGLSETPEPGNMCVEQAVCYVLGEDISTDRPSCVNPAVRSFVVRLNDAEWSSHEARARGMRWLAVAQLGTDTGFDDVKFTEKLNVKTVNEIISELPGLSDEIRKQCREAVTLEQAKNAAADAYAAARAAHAARAAARAARAAARAAHAARAAARAAHAADADIVLTKAAKIATDILIEMKTPGSLLVEEQNDDQ